jgi:peptide/nickel transport system substrate-binding protein
MAEQGLTRREIVERGGAAAAALAGLGLLADSPARGAVLARSERALDAAARSGTLVVGDFDVANALDPDGVNSVYIPNLNAIAQMYDPAVYPARVPNPSRLGGGITLTGKKRALPVLVRDWKVSKDGSDWLFSVRRNVRSVFGNRLTAEDFKWSYDRGIAHGATANFIYVRLMKVKSLEAVDTYSFRVRTDGPSPAFIPFYSTSFPWFYPIDSTEAKKHVAADDRWADKWLAQNNAGFGPYRLVSWTPAQQMTFEARDDYFGPKPFFRRVQVLAIPNAATRLAALQKGDIDLALTLPQQAVTTASRSQQLKITQFDSNYQVWVYLSYKVPQLKDRRVRQALAYAVPYQQILERVYAGRGELPKTMMPNYVPCGTDKHWHYQTNENTAKQLLQQAGVGSFSMQLWYPTDNPEMDTVAAVLQSAWGKIGVNVTLNKQPQNDLIVRNRTQKDLDAYLGDWFSPIAYDGAIASGAGFFTTGAITNNVLYSNPEWDRLAAQGIGTFNQGKRCQIYDQVQKIFMDDLPLIIIAKYRATFPMKKELQDFAWFPDHGVRFATMRR